MAGGRSAEQRADIQGLRAVAVGAVLLFHLWPNRLSGGFVGVDVFFVISGFLIGSHLLRELRISGRIRLGRFWARRAKRLLPASLLVLAAVVVATTTLIPLSERRTVLGDVIGSTFYVQNWVLANRSVDYLAADDAPSPVQHFWTLSVEEQFYVLLPLLLVLLAVGHRRRASRGTRRSSHLLPVTVVPVLLVLTAASLAYSIHLTSTEPGIAYFSTATRAWEFLAGVLLAALLPQWGRGVRAVLGWVGLAAIATTLVLFDQATPFPGYTAALPVLGAVALLAAADAGPLAWASRLRPVTWVGDLSYAIYLWHWPLVVLVPYATGEPLRTLDKVAILAVTLLLSWASTRLVEDPVRFSPRLLGGQRTAPAVGAWMLAATCAVGGAAYASAEHARVTQDRLREEIDQLQASEDFRCLGAGQQSADDCPDFGDIIVPDPGVAPLDDYNDQECWAGGDVTETRVCRLPLEGEPAEPADADSALRVLAIGDSHNNMYLPAYEALQEATGWEIDVSGRGGCSWGTIEQTHHVPARRDECRTWKRNVEDYLAETEPYDLIITTSLQTGFLAQPAQGESAEAATVRGLREAWESQIERGAVIVAIQDIPLAREDVVRCVETERFAADERCALPASAAFAGFDALTPAVEETPGSALVSLRDLICADEECLPVVGNVVVYRDPSHLTATFVRSLAPILIERIEEAATRAEQET